MIDQLTIGDKSSFDDFAASVAQRKIRMPKKKSIKETVPFSNLTYDFSAINGETYWEERELEYIFEITADNPEKLEELKSKFAAWVMGVQAEELHDPHIPDYHFLATYSDMEPEDDEGLDKTTLTVKFTAYPYMIANYPKVYDIPLPSSEELKLHVFNESEHPVPLTIANDTNIVFQVLNVSPVGPGFHTVVLKPGEGTYSALLLPKGMGYIVIANSEAKDGTVRISFREEVF